MIFNQHILSVDDSNTTFSLLKAIFGNKGIEVLSASTGRSAIKILNQEKINLIVMDIVIPKINGLDLIKRIKENEKTKNIPVIVLTAAETKKYKDKAIQMGAVDYIEKPFQIDSFVDVVEKNIIKN